MEATNGNAHRTEAGLDEAGGRRPLGELFVEPERVPVPDETRVAFAEIGRSLTDLHASLEGLAAARDDDALATAARLSATDAIVAELEARLDALAVLVPGLRADVSSLVERGAGGHLDEVAALRVETASLAGRLDELLGLRHSDAHAARAANERLDARLTALVDERAREIEVALLERLSALGEQLIRSAGRKEKPGKRLRHSIDALTVAITDARAAVAEGDRPRQS
jgi:hypothetical protein